VRLVVLARVPRGYSFADDRIVRGLQADGHEVVAVVAHRLSIAVALREWIQKLGWKIVVKKARARLTIRRGRGSAQAPLSDSATAPPPVVWVSSHRTPEVTTLVRAMEPDLLVLRGCGIIGGDLISVAKRGTINPHYAELPEYRGMDVTEWSVLRGHPCAVTIHWVVPEVDAGAPLISERIMIQSSDRLGDLREKCASLAHVLIRQAVAMVEADSTLGSPGPVNGGFQYFVMHPELRRLAERRLAHLDRSENRENAIDFDAPDGRMVR
jgi:methionyl-tRNA formyltransferase